MIEQVTNYSRQSGYVPPEKFHGEKITVVGAGAIGSHVALQLAQMGIGQSGSGELHIYDYDVVEEHNLPNQAYRLQDVGRPKVEALQGFIEDKMGFSIEAHNEKITKESGGSSITSSRYVFLAVDSMEARKEILENFLEFNSCTKLMLESRMGLTEGMVFAINPQDYQEVDVWKSKWYSNEESEAGGCGGSEAVASTSIFIATFCVSTMMHHFKKTEMEFQPPVIKNETHIQLDPFGLIGFDYHNISQIKQY